MLQTIIALYISVTKFSVSARLWSQCRYMPWTAAAAGLRELSLCVCWLCASCLPTTQQGYACMFLLTSFDVKIRCLHKQMCFQSVFWSLRDAILLMMCACVKGVLCMTESVRDSTAWALRFFSKLLLTCNPPWPSGTHYPLHHIPHTPTCEWNPRKFLLPRCSLRSGCTHCWCTEAGSATRTPSSSDALLKELSLQIGEMTCFEELTQSNNMISTTRAEHRCSVVKSLNSLESLGDMICPTHKSFSFHVGYFYFFVKLAISAQETVSPWHIQSWSFIKVNKISQQTFQCLHIAVSVGEMALGELYLVQQQ